MEDCSIRLMNAYKALFEMKGQCSKRVYTDCINSHLTVTQKEYLQIIDRYEYITLSQLARETNNSKPTVTEMVKKFIDYQCITKEKCSTDGRKTYLRLTEKGRRIARLETNSIKELVNEIEKRLSEEERKELVVLLERVVNTN